MHTFNTVLFFAIMAVCGTVILLPPIIEWFRSRRIKRELEKYTVRLSEKEKDELRKKGWPN